MNLVVHLDRIKNTHHQASRKTITENGALSKWGAYDILIIRGTHQKTFFDIRLWQDVPPRHNCLHNDKKILLKSSI